MPEHIHYDDRDLQNPETHHEHSDVPIRPLFLFLIIFVLFAIASHFVVLFLHRGFAKMERGRESTPMTAVQRPESERVPNQPLLQPYPREQKSGEVLPPQRTTPVTDMDDMRKAEEEALRNYGWVDQQKGVVRLPIQRAKDLLVERGLPVATVPATAPAATTTAPGNVATPPANVPQTPAAAPTEGDPNPARIPAGQPAQTAPARVPAGGHR